MCLSLLVCLFVFLLLVRARSGFELSSDIPAGPKNGVL